MWGFIVFLIVGGVIGWLGQLIVGKGVPGGVIGNIIVGWIGSAIGGYVPFVQFGPELGGFHLLPAIIGAVILVAVIDLITAR